MSRIILESGDIISGAVKIAVTAAKVGGTGGAAGVLQGCSRGGPQMEGGLYIFFVVYPNILPQQYISHCAYKTAFYYTFQK